LDENINRNRYCLLRFYFVKKSYNIKYYIQLNILRASMQPIKAFLFIFFICLLSSFVNAEALWGAKYFPNVELTDHDGNKVRFFDDMIKDKIVALNFIYTSCPDSCPLETAQLVKVQNILGDRIGKDVFIYSITIDPDVDTYQVMNEYREKFGAKWDFLTGNEQDIIKIRRKLGLYIEEIQDGSNNHNVSMIIGNQKTGRWMKRSPFENPHVLADQIGNWLDGWKAPQVKRDYADAPKLRNISRGEQLYRTRCAICHTLTGKELKGAVGPDLIGVIDIREKQWLYDWLKAPDQMLAKKDPIAVALYKKYNRVAMPNMRLNQSEVKNLLEHIDAETKRIRASEGKIFETFKEEKEQVAKDQVAVMNAWVREPIVESDIHAGYFTLFNMSDSQLVLQTIESQAYAKVEIHEMKHVNGLMKMKEVEELSIPANSKVTLAPRGMHLMLIKPNQEIKSGGQVKLKLIFNNGKTQDLVMPIRSK
jgi:protein SCO1/2